VSATILEVDNLTVTFDTDEGVFNAVEAVSFAIAAGEVVGLVGESGCGKSVTALSILRLIPSPPGRITAGSVRFKGADLAALSAAELRRVRGSGISMIFQEPSAALSPLHRVGRQLVEALRLHRDLSRRAAWEAARDWLEKVRIPDAAERLYAYPFQLSGGMQQRVMIAMALMLEPEVIIADEPTTALDVTIQAQVFALIREMKQASTAILLITHDMGVVWEMCDRVLVMYAARIVEAGTREEIFEKPAHPYTRGLLRSIPRLTDKPERLATIGGMVPSPLHYPAGCRFNDRCPHVFDRCRREAPGLLEVSEGHRAACFLAKKLVRAPL
jgi:peptide/nickel transport system ATP-binding protein/oligopeptide transport system ATP-binding protein